MPFDVAYGHTIAKAPSAARRLARLLPAEGPFRHLTPDIMRQIVRHVGAHEYRGLLRKKWSKSTALYSHPTAAIFEFVGAYLDGNTWRGEIHLPPSEREAYEAARAFASDMERALATGELEWTQVGPKFIQGHMARSIPAILPPGQALEHRVLS